VIKEKEEIAKEKLDWLSVNHYMGAIQAMLRRSEINAERQGEIVGRISRIQNSAHPLGANRLRGNGTIGAKNFSRMTLNQLIAIPEDDIDSMSPELLRAYTDAISKFQDTVHARLVA
jgi:hypothetical protein